IRRPTVELPMLVLLRYGIHWSEVYHIHTSRYHDLRNAKITRSGQAFWTRTTNAAAQFIRQFGGGNIQDTVKITLPDQGLHCPTSLAISMKSKHLIASGFQQLGTLVYTGRRVPNHADANSAGCMAVRGLRGIRHGTDCRRRLSNDHFTDAVQASHIHHRRNQDNILTAHMPG